MFCGTSGRTGRHRYSCQQQCSAEVDAVTICCCPCCHFEWINNRAKRSGTLYFEYIIISFFCLFLFTVSFVENISVIKWAYATQHVHTPFIVKWWMFVFRLYCVFVSNGKEWIKRQKEFVEMRKKKCKWVCLNVAVGCRAHWAVCLIGIIEFIIFFVNFFTRRRWMAGHSFDSSWWHDRNKEF